MAKINRRMAAFACFGVLLTSGLASAAGKWGPFGPTNSWENQGLPCNDPKSFLFSSTPVIWGDVLVVHGKIRSPTGQLRSQYEAVYAHNVSSLDVPVDLGVITTNDNFTGLYIPFQYREFYGVRLNAEVEVVTYEGAGLHTLAACRVRTS